MNVLKTNRVSFFAEARLQDKSKNFILWIVICVIGLIGLILGIVLIKRKKKNNPEQQQTVHFAANQENVSANTNLYQSVPNHFPNASFSNEKNFDENPPPYALEPPLYESLLETTDGASCNPESNRSSSTKVKYTVKTVL